MSDEVSKADVNDLVDVSGFYVYKTPEHLKDKFNDNLRILEIQSESLQIEQAEQKA